MLVLQTVGVDKKKVSSDEKKLPGWSATRIVFTFNMKDGTHFKKPLHGKTDSEQDNYPILAH